MSRSIRELLAVTHRKYLPVYPPDAVGVEVEVEFASRRALNEFVNDVVLPAEVKQSWSFGHDGSLRNGIEFNTLVPGEDYRSDLNSLGAVLQNPDHWFVVSNRCSVHVHVNMLENTKAQLTNYLLAYAAFEGVFNLITGERLTNNYCMSMSQATPYYRDILSRLVYYPARPLRGMRDIKYAGVSLGRLDDLGTFEFRCHEGTLDAGRMITWVDLLLAVKRLACRWKHSDDLLEYLDDTWDSIGPKVFDLLYGYIERKVEDHDRLCDAYRKGYYVANALMWGHPNHEDDIEPGEPLLLDNLQRLVAKEGWIPPEERWDDEEEEEDVADAEWDVGNLQDIPQLQDDPEYEDEPDF